MVNTQSIQIMHAWNLIGYSNSQLGAYQTAMHKKLLHIVIKWMQCFMII